MGQHPYANDYSDFRIYVQVRTQDSLFCILFFLESGNKKIVFTDRVRAYTVGKDDLFVVLAGGVLTRGGSCWRGFLLEGGFVVTSPSRCLFTMPCMIGAHDLPDSFQMMCHRCVPSLWVLGSSARFMTVQIGKLNWLE